MRTLRSAAGAAGFSRCARAVPLCMLRAGGMRNAVTCSGGSLGGCGPGGGGGCGAGRWGLWCVEARAMESATRRVRCLGHPSEQGCCSPGHQPYHRQDHEPDHRPDHAGHSIAQVAAWAILQGLNLRNGFSGPHTTHRPRQGCTAPVPAPAGTGPWRMRPEPRSFERPDHSRSQRCAAGWGRGTMRSVRRLRTDRCLPPKPTEQTCAPPPDHKRPGSRP